MQITPDLIKYLESLARITLSESEEEKVGKELQDILTYIDTLNELLLQQKCQIKVIFFSDTYRFKEKEMLALTLNDILHQLDKNTVAITLTKKEEISDLTKNSVFYQQNKNMITNGKNQYPCL